MKARAGTTRISTDEAILLTAVLVHVTVTGNHDFAHAQAKIAMSPGAVAFALCAILIGWTQGSRPGVRLGEFFCFRARITSPACSQGQPRSTADHRDEGEMSMSDMVRAVAKYAGAKRDFLVPAWVRCLITPFTACMMSMRLPLLDGKTRAEAGRCPVFPSRRDGFARIAARLEENEHA